MTRPIERTEPRAFTLLEMLVVIVIILLLVALVIGAGANLLTGQKRSQTENVLQSLDRALDETITERGGTPPPFVRDAYINVPGTRLVFSGGDPNDETSWIDPDGDGQDDPPFPDAAVFLRQARGVGAVDAILRELGDRWLVPTPQPESGEPNAEDGTPSVLDAWAEQGWRSPWPVLEQSVIYYVHPDNEAAQQLYGRCLNGRPYFFSAGPDRFHGTSAHRSGTGEFESDLAEEAIADLADNVYTYEPGPANTSESFTAGWR